MPLFLSDAAVITMDPVSGAVPITASIRIVDELIVAIGPGLVPEPGDEVIDGRDRLVVPGFVNAHTHSWEYLYKGRYDNLPLELWMLLSYPILGNSRVAPDLVRLRSSLFALESLKAGVTTLVDDVLENPDQDAEQLAAVFDAYDEIGVRANISGHVISRPFHETMPFLEEYVPAEILDQARSASRPTTEGYLAFSREAFATQHGRGGGRLRYMVAPSAPQRCGPELLVGATELALEHGAECHIHVLETKTQLVTGELSYGSTLVEYMERIGALSPNTTFAHGIWLTDSDMERIAAAGTSVSHNPISNLKLGSGIAPWRALHDAGVNLGLGTDGCSSSDTPRMLDVVKAAALLHKVTDPDIATWPTVSEVLTAGTIGGARSAVLDGVTGSIEVGKQADLVVYDLETLNFTPRQRLENQLVYSENGSSIDTVIVAGRIVVSKGVSTTVDEAALRADLAAQLGEIVAWQDSLDRTNGVLTEPFRRMYERAMRHDAPVDRFSGRRLV
ncbi:amidohydrolase [Rathayibacter sp. AY1E9]|nr:MULTISPECIES: amidohydrolase [unclassified Rathayibacter]PPG48716.1 amidohydrolase [Rathayibacter sp. AY1E9]PPG56130.1 amidohydrolase [Rathayibacter sp. AY1C5]PPH08112.1 amidohydrolase [Rathayibacter sp. AY1H3]PPH78271.1 amidohydrolase [Rathayibacter sp. AY1D9]